MTIIINVGNNAFGGIIVSNDEYEKKSMHTIAFELFQCLFIISLHKRLY